MFSNILISLYITIVHLLDYKYIHINYINKIQIGQILHSHLIHRYHKQIVTFETNQKGA